MPCNHSFSILNNHLCLFMSLCWTLVTCQDLLVSWTTMTSKHAGLLVNQRSYTGLLSPTFTKESFFSQSSLSLSLSASHSLILCLWNVNKQHGDQGQPPNEATEVCKGTRQNEVQERVVLYIAPTLTFVISSLIKVDIFNLACLVFFTLLGKFCPC